MGQVGNLRPIGNRPSALVHDLRRRVNNPPQVANLPHNMTDPREVRDEPPPVLGSWPAVYKFVLFYVACVIAAFYVFTRAFAP